MKSKKKIFFCLPNFSSGGAEQVMINLFQEFNDHNNNLIVLNEDGPLRSRVTTKKKIISLKCNKGRFAIFPLVKIFNIEKPNIIISTMAYFNFIIMISLLMSNCKPERVVLREANTPESSIKSNFLGIFYFYFYKIFYNRADIIICNSYQVLNELVSLGVNKKRITYIPNPLSINEIRKKAEENIMLPNFANANLPFFIGIGRLVEQKGMDRVLNSFSKIKLPANLLILGDGPKKKYLEDQIKKLKLKGRVALLGYTDNPYPFLSSSIALLIGSRWEGFPNVALESFVLGVPVITTSDSGGLSEIKNKINKKYLAISNNENEFVTAMEKILKKTNKESNSDLYKSILPKEFYSKNVLKKFRKLILKS